MVRARRRRSKSTSSLANFALDLIGQATFFSSEAGDADVLAFHRDVLDYKNCLLVEQPNGDFAQTIARHLLFPTWQHMLYSAGDSRTVCAGSREGFQGSRLSSGAGRGLDVRLGDGTEESARRMAEGLDWYWRFVPELFEVDDSLQAADGGGIGADPREFEEEYRSAIAAVLAEAELERRPTTPDPRRTARSPQRASRPFARSDAVPAAHLP